MEYLYKPYMSWPDALRVVQMEPSLDLKTVFQL